MLFHCAPDLTEVQSASISCAQLAELRMDENDLAGDASTLAPLCKLRSVRTLSLEKNRLLKVR